MDIADPTATFQQGLALHQQGRLDEADAHYRFVLGAQPAHFGALHLTGLIQYQRGNFAAAVELIGRAIAIDPNADAPHSNLGLALLALKRPEEALASFERALRLKPEVPSSLNNRGNALLALGRSVDALADYDRALKWQPGFALAHNNRGNTLRALGRADDALGAYDNALRLAPDYPEALDNRGRVLRDLKRFEEAARSFARLLAVAPGQPYAAGMLLASRFDGCDWSDADSASAAIVAAVQRGECADAPFSFVSHCLSPAVQLDCARLFAAAEYPIVPPLATTIVRRHERIRLAYVSADFHDHPVAFLVAGLFEQHDRDRFEVTAISYGPGEDSAKRARVKAGVDRFVDVRGSSDRAAAGLIAEAEIDVAIDLTGYTAGNRAGIMAHHAAPVQVSYLGYPGTTGAPFIDYLIADRHVVPSHLEAAYCEKIVRLPDTYQVNDRQRRIAERTPTRSEAGLPEQGFVFCSFNNNYKIRPAPFDVWMRLLHAVEGSVLWLLEDNAAAVANLKAAATARGIPETRLVFAPRVPLDRHLARHRLADLFLDTFPFNAHTTASDALWTGLPLVTMRGETFASRVASSLLSAADLPELVTDSLADYEALALKLARDPREVARLKAHLDRERLTMPLFDTALFCRHIERAYSMMYERCARGEPPASFDV